MLKEIFGYFIDEYGNLFNKHGKKLKFYDNGKGYLIVQLRFNGRAKNISQHRLVALAHVPNPESKPEVDHIDGNRKNNYKGNLRWVTKEENVQDSYTTGCKSSKGHLNGRATFTEKEVRVICRMFSDGMTSPEVSKYTGRSYHTIRRIRQRKTWKHISDHYEWT